MDSVHGHNNSRAVAFATVLLMLLCSFTAMAGADADGTGPYDIYMQVDDTFTYTPQTNLDTVGDGTITFTSATTYSATKTGTYVSDDTFSFPANAVKGASFSGTPTKAGYYVSVLTATWNYTDSATQQKLTQTATQTINFEVIDHISFDGASDYGDYTKNLGVAKATNVGTELFSTYIDTPSGASFTESDFQIDGASFSSDSKFTYTLSSGVLTVKVNKDLTELEDKKYVLTFPASYKKTVDSTDVISDSATLTVNINLGNTAITTDRIVTYIGETTTGQTTGYKTFDLEYTPAMTDMTWTVNSQDAANMVSFPSSSAGTVLIDTTKVTNDSIGSSAVSKEITFNVSVAGTYTSDSSVQGFASKDITIEIFKKFDFTSKPTVSDNVRTVASSVSNKEVLLETTIKGAKSLTYNWGDGKGFTTDVSSQSSSVFTANHEYSEAKVYTIKITATNDFGSRSMVILYDATTGMNLGTVAGGDDDNNNEEQDKGFFEEHGYMFLLLIILGVVALGVYFVYFRAPIMVIVAAVLVILGLMFFGNVFGLHDLFNF